MNTTDQERMALNCYLGDNWVDFVKSAKQFLTDDEIEVLALKLEEDQ